jgi:hypothetical protein
MSRADMSPAYLTAFQGGDGHAFPPQDWNGALLSADGNLGPRTEWALAMADLPRLRRDVARVATGELGEKEVTENDSPRIRVYKAPIGGKPGEAWCAYGASYVLRTARVPGAIYTGSARTALHQFPATLNPQPWDLAGWVNPDGTGHVFFVAGFAPNPEGGLLPLDVVGLEFNSGNSVRLTRRPQAGLIFAQLPTIEWAPLILDTAIPRIKRETAGTR